MTIKDITRHFLNIGTYKGLINADIQELRVKIDKNISVLDCMKEDIIFSEIKQMEEQELKELVGIHNPNLYRCVMQLENNINEYEELLKKRYMEFGAILYEIENEYI